MNLIKFIKTIINMREKSRMIRHEQTYGPHFNEELALRAVSKMENEDGTRGAHWSIEETTTVANQYNVNLKSAKYNKYDWFVALNMIYSDYFRAVVNMTSSDHIKSFVELTKAWLNDKDITEGKMWYYYCYLMREDVREDCDYDDEDDEYYDYGVQARGRMKRPRYYEDDYERNRERRYEPYRLSRY